MLDSIFSSIKKAAIEVNSLLGKCNFTYLNSTNSTGDKQLQIDVLSNNIFKDVLLELDSVKGICSEEENEIIYKKDCRSGFYIVAFDPLDGSSIVDSNFSVGSIFGIYNNELSAKNLIASGYVLYGVRLEIVIAQSDVNHYVYDGVEWRFIGNLVLNQKGNLNAPGGTQKSWLTNHKILIESLFLEGYRLRYSGGMVPDLHNILVKGGGLFSYPSTNDAPNGKLRALFEVFPFAFIFEKAYGEAIDGKNRLLDLEIDSLHQSLPCFFGSKYEIERVKLAYK
ncbi:class 1 fructose-bisphosphatase [Helicobacter sp. MIT 14-3879]|uniref:class 1 fructose-bisphosphatase n=1 Tax=Helicobacter sp. MIT 14-3879 TaxID=2040649 RepID=UPI000E1F1FBF|nr:class 1 fructose-bisphosphatase [Helicobacter sp. MIT 14-3879]RDU61644.1 class 1 fructose-bisphosphatase [Helicobacter sp. MIT 14-3879]